MDAHLKNAEERNEIDVAVFALHRSSIDRFDAKTYPCEPFHAFLNWRAV